MALKTVLRAIRLGVLGLLMIYWVIFIGSTFTNLIFGGGGAVEKYYWQLFYNHGALTPAPVRLQWGLFLLAQAIYLGITLALLFFEWRWRKQQGCETLEEQRK